MSAQSCITGPVGIPITATGKQDRRDVHDNRIESRRRCARRGGLRRAVAQSPPRRRQSADSAPINVTWAKWRCTWSPSSSFGAWKCSATWMKTASVRWCESSGQTEPAPLCRWPSGARRWSRRRTGRPQRSPGSGARARRSARAVGAAGGGPQYPTGKDHEAAAQQRAHVAAAALCLLRAA